MAAGSAAFLFHFGEIRAFVPVRFGVVIVGNGVETRSFGSAAGDDGVRHTHNGRGIHAAAELGQDGAVRAKSAADGFREDVEEVLFIFSVGAVTDSGGRIEIPILADRVLPRPYEY